MPELAAMSLVMLAGAPATAASDDVQGHPETESST
jgi:hypothetical protein